MRFVATLLLGLLLTSCATVHGPRTITLTTDEIEQRVRTDLGDAMELFRGSELRRPEVGLRPASGRLQLDWRIKLPDGPTGAPIGVLVELTGKPTLNATGSAIDLTEVRIEDVRFDGLPRFLSLARLGDKKGTSLPDLPLMSLPPERLKQDGVIYGATAVSVGFTGLRVDIAPK